MTIKEGLYGLMLIKYFCLFEECPCLKHISLDHNVLSGYKKQKPLTCKSCQVQSQLFLLLHLPVKVGLSVLFLCFAIGAASVKESVPHTHTNTHTHWRTHTLLGLSAKLALKK